MQLKEAVARCVTWGVFMPNRIRALRKQNNMTMKDLACIIGTSQQQIDRLEKGQRKLTIDWVDKLIQAFECEIFDILPDRFNKRNVTVTAKAKVIGRVIDGMNIEWFKNDESYHIIFGRPDAINNSKLFALCVETKGMNSFSNGSELIFSEIDSIDIDAHAENSIFVCSDKNADNDNKYFIKHGLNDTAKLLVKAKLIKSIRNEV